jgi:hypothetical protein
MDSSAQQTPQLPIDQERIKDSISSFRNADSKRQVIIILIATGVLIFLAFVALWISQEFTARRSLNPSEEKVQTKETPATNPNDTVSQDQQRRIDVTNLNSALKTFFAENGKAPVGLSELVPRYLARMPTDPVSKKEYNYRPADDLKSWRVFTILSNGNRYEVAGPD